MLSGKHRENRIRAKPRADEIKEHVLNLAEFEIKPKLF
jgi:hypothetical protein